MPHWVQTMMSYNKHIAEYIDLVESGSIPVCKEQTQLIARVKVSFTMENIYLDEEQLEKYLDLQKYFAYNLLPWEKFCFALHNCVYWRNTGQLRWPNLNIVVGRGAGKNGYLAFENFCLLTPINGVRNYDIDIFATSEEQAKTTFDDIYEVLELNEAKMKRHFYWTKEKITNLKTNSSLKFRTSAPKTKDGGRPGKVDFDELHAYENNKLIDVALTGLGKKAHPRRTVISTWGDVRDGPFDEMIATGTMVLQDPSINDNGFLYFICRIESEAEVKDKAAWPKANPSYLSFPHLQHEMDIEFAEFLQNENSHAAFPTKRLNWPRGNKDAEVTTWDNIKAASVELPNLDGLPCVWGIDFASTTDFVSAGLLFKQGNQYWWKTHTWVCKDSKDLSRIKAPISDWEAAGLLTMVDDVEVSPELPINWLINQRQTHKYKLVHGAIDHFRVTIFKKFLQDANAGFDIDRKKGNVKMIYNPDINMIAPQISRIFIKKQLGWGENPLMRWFTNNAKIEIDTRGNITYGKIEGKSRKTDGFMAFVAAMTVEDRLDRYNRAASKPLPVFTY